MAQDRSSATQYSKPCNARKMSPSATVIHSARRPRENRSTFTCFSPQCSTTLLASRITNSISG